MTYREHEHDHEHDRQRDPRPRGGRRGPGPRGWGRGRWAAGSEERASAEQRAEIKAWFTGRLPDDFYTDAPEVTIDNDEILVVGALSAVALEQGAAPEVASTAEEARIERFREDTREHRIRIAEEARARFGRVVSWGATVGSTSRLFTTANVPVMTRLRMSQRQVLDTLIDAGIARSRSEALAWCVELVGRNESEWIDELRDAFARVEEVRAQGPNASRPTSS
ncbi:MAG: hypothetical protein ABSG36_10810 [Acidimicrobiales bacterium]|jgi:hypothetical protein